MKILVLTQSFSGCGYHRLMLPVSLMQKEKARITDVFPEEFDYDIVNINRLWPKDDLIELRKKHGFKLVVDVDDFWILDNWHLDFDTYNKYNVDARIIKHLKEADLVTCTHERLAEKVYYHNKNVEILPNAIPYGQNQFTSERNASDLVRLFWAGGISHEEDLKILRPVMKRVLNSDLKDKVKMIVGGYSDSNITEQTIWKKMVSYFTADALLPNMAYRGLPVFEYYQMYLESDIKLIPLRKSTFNGYKTNLKILEAAGKGIPVIVSKVDPYLGFPKDVVYYENWDKNIRALVEDKDLREAKGRALFEYCNEHYNFDEINEKRKTLFQNLCS
jgi:glycosyltransferase involved in cell wall biosynthesis